MAGKLHTSEYIGEVKMKDPDSLADVTIAIYKHQNGGMFGVDASYLEQEFEDNEIPTIPDPLGNRLDTVELIEM